MTKTETIDQTVQAGTDYDDNHICCCEDEDRGLCGLDLASYTMNDEVETTCVVCADLDDLDCEDFCPNAR